MIPPKRSPTANEPRPPRPKATTQVSSRQFLLLIILLLAIGGAAWIGGLLQPKTIIVLLRSDGSLEVESGESYIHWYCNITDSDKTLCRGRADRIRTVLKYDGAQPIKFKNKTLMLYRSQGRIVGVQVGYYAENSQAMIDKFAHIIKNYYDRSFDPVSRACGKNDASAAIAAAVANFNERSSSICADIGLTRITWRFAKFMDTPDQEHRLMELSIQSPDLVGPWWL